MEDFIFNVLNFFDLCWWGWCGYEGFFWVLGYFEGNGELGCSGKGKNLLSLFWRCGLKISRGVDILGIVILW